MPGRQDTELARLYHGNLLLYDYLQSKRNPTFLRRNLRRAFELHQEAIERAGGDAVIQTAGLEHRDRALWRMPSQERIKAQLQKREFQLVIKAIKPTNEDGTPKKLDQSPLKKKVPLFRTPVSVNASIWHLRTGHKCELHSDQYATLLGIQTSHGKVVSVNASTITSNPEKFKLPPDAQDESSKRQGLPEDFEIMITVDFNSSVDVEDILSIMDVDLPRLEGAIPTRWRAKYPTILDLPEKEVSLPLTYHVNGGKSKTLGLGLEVCMRYTSHPGESLLSAANRQLKSEQRRVPPLPTRAAQKIRSKIEVTFVFLHETLTFRALHCPHCTQRIRHPFKSLDELHMHLRNSHELFQYRVRKENEVNGTQSWRFECDIADHKAEQRPSDRAPDPRDINIIAPRRPFNQRKYLEGDEGWLKDARLERQSRPTLARALPSATTKPISRKAPDEVQPRVDRDKKKHRVPRAPVGVTFFRTLTKRPLREGEFISESDDEVDMDWLQSKTDSMITNDRALPEKRKRFLIGFNNYIREERLQDDVHVGDALIRFANSEREWLCREGIQDEFKKKVTEFLEDQIISREIHDRCIEIVSRPQVVGVPSRISRSRSANQPTPPRTPLSPTHNSKVNESPRSQNAVTGSILSEFDQWFKSNTDRQNKGKAKVTALGQTTPQTTDFEGDVEMAEANGDKEPPPTDSKDTPPKYYECLCGRPAFAHSGSSIIHCENDECIRGTFHIDCVLRQWKPKEKPDSELGDWYCRDCEGNPDIDTGGQTRYGD